MRFQGVDPVTDTIV